MLSKTWMPKGGSKNRPVRTQTQNLPKPRAVAASSVEILLDQHAMMCREYTKASHSVRGMLTLGAIIGSGVTLPLTAAS